MIMCVNKEDLKGKSGVYKITNIETRKFYVGSSKNLWKRANDHERDLKNNRHCNKYLQDEYDKFSSDSFKFEVIEYCDEDIRKDREQIYLTFYKDDERFYNIATDAKASFKGKHHSNEFKRELSQRVKGKNNPMYGKTGELNHNYGKHLSDETKQKLSKAHKGIHAGENNYFYDVHMSGEEHPRAKTIYMYDLQGNLISSFGCIKDSAKYLLDNNIIISNAKDPIKTIAEVIRRVSESNKPFHDYIFSLNKLENLNSCKNIIYIYDLEYNLLNTFSTIKDCAKWLLDNEIVTSNAKEPMKSISGNISYAMKRNNPYKNLIFSYELLDKIC